MKLLCVPKRKGTGNQRPYVIMWRPYLHFFCFWYNMSITLGSLCKKILSNSFEETVLWLWTLKEKKGNKNKNLELCWMLLISKTCMQLKVSRLYELHKAMERRKDWIGTVMAKVSSQSINDNFCNTCWWTQVQKGTSWVPKEKWKSVEPKKSSI